MPNKIIAVTGDRDGVGKTTLAINIAARISQTKHQPVMLIDTDPLCRGESAQAAGVNAVTNVLQILDQLASKQVSWPMLRGRVAVNSTGVGVIPLAPHVRETERLTPDQWSFFLQG